jgi:membrane-associated phospholipid phosphatase
MQALTDFADEAVVLPLIAVVALMLGLLGWRRGALAWLGAVGLSFTAVLALKLVFTTCGPMLGLPALRSPSGHTAASAVIAGGIAVVLGLGRQQIAAIAGVAAVLIGTTRVVLGLHTPPEVAVGGALGILGVLGFAVVAGKPPALRLRWLFAAIIAAALLLHGQHLDAETSIRAVAFGLALCR